MKSFIPLIFAAGAYAQASVAVTEIGKVNSATTDLNSAVTAFNGAAQVAALQSASENLISVINSAAGTIGATSSDKYTIVDAFTITGPAGQLRDNVVATVDNAISKKDTLVGAGVGAIVLDQLQQQKTAAQALIDAITLRLPAGTEEIAAGLTGPIIDALNKAIAEFQDQASSVPTGGAPSTTAAVPTGVVPTGVSSLSSVPTVIPTGLPESCIPGTTTVTVTVTGGHPAPSVSKPVGTGSYIVPTGTYTHVPSKSPTPPAFTGAASMPTAAVGYAVAGLAILAAF